MRYSFKTEAISTVTHFLHWLCHPLGGCRQGTAPRFFFAPLESNSFLSPLVLSFSMALLVTLVTDAKAESVDQIYINVGKASIKKSLVALPPFQHLGSPTLSSRVQSLSTELFNTVYNDLTSTGYFQFQSHKAFLEDPNKVGLRPKPATANGFDFENWKKIGTEFLIRAGFVVKNNQLELQAYVYYVTQPKLVFAKTYKASRQHVRRLAHTFANDVIEKLTGKKGIFNTKIVAIRGLGRSQPGRQIKEVYTMDWDGHGIERISHHKSLALSPTWSPDGRYIAYSAYIYHKSYRKKNVDLLTYDRKTKTRKIVSSRNGYNSGADFFPDSKSLLLTISIKGNSNLYKINMKGNILRKLTSGPPGSLNVEGVVSPDGKKIAFSSTRGGQPMIYIMDVNGKNIKRRTIAGRYNASPAWSPDSTKIAFAGQDDDHFDVFLMDANGTNMIRLTTARKIKGSKKYSNNENPSFSPDGRHVLYVSNRTGHNQIYMVNVDGSNERRITFDNFNYYQPRWSPYLD